MQELIDPITSWAARLWPLLVNHLWQSTLFVLLLLPAAFALRRAPARLRYRLSLIAGVKFLIPSALLYSPLARLDLEGLLPAVSLLSLDFSRLLGAFGGDLEAVVARDSGAVITTALTALWLGGAGLCGFLWQRNRRTFARTLARARRVTAGREVELLEGVRARLGIRRPVALALLPGGTEPGVWRTLRPVLVLPEEMPRHLTGDELEALFLHELLHVRRWDNLVANLQMLLCCAFWFHPLVWLLDRRLLAEREEACDEAVLALTGSGEHYLRGLLKAVRFGIGWRLAGVSSAHASNLRRRLERIRSGALNVRASAPERVVVGAVALLLCAFTVAATPSAWKGVPGCGGEKAADRCAKEGPHLEGGGVLAVPRIEAPELPPEPGCDETGGGPGARPAG